IVKAQSQCPFRAFAEFRLSAQRPEDACFGFDARDRGGFLHKALQYVWNRLESQDRLCATEAPELREIVHNSVLEAVKDDVSSPFHELITVTERERLEELILDWLQIERARKQPFVVETLEQERSCEIAGLPLRLRVDRIDRLSNGKLLLIDYKSGKQSRNKLECPRPAEPQLWVYAAATGNQVDGVFFGEMKARELRAVGFSRERHFGGVSITVKGAAWDGFLENCTREVERIAAGFVQGDAAVDPIPGACEYCNVKPFCRVNEQRRLEQEPE
ncbi:MAG: PD-(D/E)XK nuclease family protein, partial [Acidobacteriaceae bacterium]|nr:PD-(D/E)XK nuclease family protein [Acidobacteriaceae bacterium]